MINKINGNPRTATSLYHARPNQYYQILSAINFIRRPSHCQSVKNTRVVCGCLPPVTLSLNFQRNQSGCKLINRHKCNGSGRVCVVRSIVKCRTGCPNVINFITSPIPVNNSLYHHRPVYQFMSLYLTFPSKYLINQSRSRRERCPIAPSMENLNFNCCVLSAGVG